jgi:hypothetical protein
MVADRAYWPGLLESPNGRASLLYFAAAVPTVGFVHGAADLSPFNAAALEGYAQSRYINPSTTSLQSSRLWPLGLRWR